MNEKGKPRCGHILLAKVVFFSDVTKYLQDFNFFVIKKGINVLPSRGKLLNLHPNMRTPRRGAAYEYSKRKE